MSSIIKKQQQKPSFKNIQGFDISSDSELYLFNSLANKNVFKIFISSLNESPRSNRHGRKRPYTEKYDDLHGPVLRSYISVSYTEKYGDIRTKKRSFTVSVNGGRIRSYTTVYRVRNVRPGLFN
jgi:hypothetical protein